MPSVGNDLGGRIAGGACAQKYGVNLNEAVFTTGRSSFSLSSSSGCGDDDLAEFASFASLYNFGKPQVVSTSLVADLETPVSALLKLADGQPYSFLLESVTGGAVRGRYSILGIKPDLVWRCRGGTAEINRRARVDRDTFEPCPEPALVSLRSLIAESRIELPDGLPLMGAGLFGHMAYDMVRQIERLPDGNPDPLGLPDAVFLRPTVVALFDHIEDRITVVTPVWPSKELSARQAYDLACERLADAVAAFNRGVSHEPARLSSPPPEPVANVTREQYHAMVERAKEYIRAGDIFQVVPSQRFEVPFGCRRSRSIVRCAGSTRRRSCSSSTSTATRWWARARRSWSGCATAR